MPKYGRHAPAFVLLFLAREPSYGLDLLNKMEENMPYNRMDSAVIYRALSKLEDRGAVKPYWDTSSSGPAKKWYQITPEGKKILAEFKKDIEARKLNFDYFLQSYQEIFPKIKDK